MKRTLLVSTVALAGLVALAQTDTPTVDETISALEGGLTNIPLDAALANIEGWQGTLEGSGDPELQELGGLLGDLALELQAETLNPAEIGNLLSSLGEGTSTAAESAGDNGLARLGTLLSDAGDSLTEGDGSSGGMTGGMTGGM